MAEEPAISNQPPVVIDTVEALIEQIKTDNPKLAAQLEKLIDDGVQIVLIKEHNAELDKAVTDLEAELSQAEILVTGQNVTIGELTAQIETLQANPSTVPTFTLGKKTYEVHSSKFKFRTGTAQIPKDYTVEELLKDKTLQAELVKKGVGFIVEKV